MAFPVKKKGGGVRPIAAGDTTRRLVAKVCCKQVQEQARTTLQPFQFGVGTPGGAEAIVHSVRTLSANPTNPPNQPLTSKMPSTKLNGKPSLMQPQNTSPGSCLGYLGATVTPLIWWWTTNRSSSQPGECNKVTHLDHCSSAWQSKQ